METLKHNDVYVTLDTMPNNKLSILIEPVNEIFIPDNRWETDYPNSLIEQILNVKGAFLIDEIRRDEDAGYVEKNFRENIYFHVPSENLTGKHILDFGCGCGSSTMVLSRMFPALQEIVGVELVPEFLDIARARAEYYKFTNVSFKLSPSEDSLPVDIELFDVVMLSAVFEHLLSAERKPLLELLWSVMKPDAILFINQTPNRWYPIEKHTTGGLPGLNFLPAWLVERLAKRYSKKVTANQNWHNLLRAGIRGGTEREIMGLLPNDAELIRPRGIKDGVDIWYAQTPNQASLKKRLAYAGFKIVAKTGLVMLPYHLNMAIRKQSG